MIIRIIITILLKKSTQQSAWVVSSEYLLSLKHNINS